MIYRYQYGEQIFEISLERHAAGYRAIVAGNTYTVEVLDAGPGELSLRFEGQPITLYWAIDGSRKWVALNGCAYPLEKPVTTRQRRGRAGRGENHVRAPMPAQVRAVQVVEGAQVEKGQTLLLLEAMKMEIRIKAPGPGKITRLAVREGQAVDRDQILVEIDAVPDSAAD